MFAELGEVINGIKPAHREKTTVFKSLGKPHLIQIQPLCCVKFFIFLNQKSSLNFLFVAITFIAFYGTRNGG